jgi:hypothetical protein
MSHVRIASWDPGAAAVLDLRFGPGVALQSAAVNTHEINKLNPPTRTRAGRSC